jgi:hypothetical protein
MKTFIYTPPDDSEEGLNTLSPRQQQPSGRNMEFLSAHASLYRVVVGFFFRSVALLWSISFKLVRNKDFFSEYVTDFT